MISDNLQTLKIVYNKQNSTDFSNFVQNFNVHESWIMNNGSSAETTKFY